MFNSVGSHPLVGRRKDDDSHFLDLCICHVPFNTNVPSLQKYLKY